MFIYPILLYFRFTSKMAFNRIYEFLLSATFVMMLYFIKAGYIRAQKIMKEWAKGGIRESLLKRGTKDD